MLYYSVGLCIASVA